MASRRARPLMAAWDVAGVRCAFRLAGIGGRKLPMTSAAKQPRTRRSRCGTAPRVTSGISGQGVDEMWAQTAEVAGVAGGQSSESGLADGNDLGIEADEHLVDRVGHEGSSAATRRRAIPKRSSATVTAVVHSAACGSRLTQATTPASGAGRMKPDMTLVSSTTKAVRAGDVALTQTKSLREDPRSAMATRGPLHLPQRSGPGALAPDRGGRSVRRQRR